MYFIAGTTGQGLPLGVHACYRKEKKKRIFDIFRYDDYYILYQSEYPQLYDTYVIVFRF